MKYTNKTPSAAFIVLCPIWICAFIEHLLPVRREGSPPEPTTWWAIPYLVTQFFGAIVIMVRCVNVIVDEEAR